MAKDSKDHLLSLKNFFSSPSRKGFFQQGEDKLGRPFEKKWDDNGFYTKQEKLKDGTMKYTIKDLRNKKK
jgi:hypothetical protein